MLNFQANLSMMFQEFEFLDRFEAAAKAGFKSVEILFPYDNEPQIIANLLTKYNLELGLFNVPPGNWEKGERGIAALPDRTAEFKQYADKAVSYAEALKCPKIHCMSGIIPAVVSQDAATQTYVENLKYIANKARPLGIQIMVEAINPYDMPNYLVNNQRQSLNIVQATGADNVKMQFDIYHCQMSQGSVATRLNEYSAHIGHIQIADVPGRHEPGTGEINFPYLFQQIENIGYNGQIGCEYIPQAGTLESLKWLPNSN